MAAPAAYGQRAFGSSTTTSTLLGLSQQQIVPALKEALTNGIESAVHQLGHDDGFLTNLNVRIPMPEKLQAIDRTSRS